MVEQKPIFIPASKRELAIPAELRELKEIERLERRHAVIQVLKTDPDISQIDSSMLRWTSQIIINSNNKEETIKKWRKLQNRQGRQKGDFSPIQQKILSLPDERLGELYDEAKKYLDRNDLYVSRVAEDRVYGDHGHRWNDSYEIRQKQKRSLEILRINGVRIHIDPEDIQSIQREYTEDVACPVLDRVKNKRIATVNGFSDSKVSVSIHDLFDHFWLYDRLEKMEILNQYRSFLQSVGNPQDTDIFKREGELIASVAFEWRSSHTPERQFKPSFDLNFIKKVFERGETKNLNENQKRAYAIIANLNPKNEEAIRLSSVYNGVLVELMEQRRQNGFIRRLNTNFEIVDNLSLLDLEYLSLIIEINHFLCDSKNLAYETLVSTEALVEDYLIGLARGDTSQDLVIRITDLETFDPAKSRISKQRQQWLNENSFHTATRVDRCED